MKAAKRLLAITLSLLLLAVPVVAFMQRQNIYDWVKLRGYDPPPAIVKLASDNTMTDKARHIFYVNHPTLIAEVTDFRASCPKSEQTIVLGCYKSPQRGIYVYDVDDARLDGVHEVTAAHEMLHAAYDRLNAKDKTSIDALLTNYYATQTDQRIKDIITAYEKSDPEDIVSEMHSIFGTEIANLPTELEDYYMQYFSSRSAVVAFSARYESEFTNRLAKIANYDRQLAVMRQDIEVQEASLKDQQVQIESDRANLDRLRDSDDVEGYNRAVSLFNAKVAAYNSGVTGLQNDIAAFNALIETRNNLAAELRSLDSSIDTRVTPQKIQ